MSVRVTPLTKVFAAQIDGADLTRPLDDTAWAAIRAAFEEHSVQRLLQRTTISG